MTKTVADSVDEEFTKVLRKYAQLPVYDSAQVLSSPDAPRVELLLHSNTRDFVQNAKKNITTYISFKHGEDGMAEDKAQFSYEENSDVVVTAAHDYVEGQKIIFRSTKTGEKKKHFVERWDQSSILDCIEVTDLQGTFYNNTISASVAFDPSPERRSRIAYVAERKMPDDETYKKFEHRYDFGEKMDGKAEPVVVILDFESIAKFPSKQLETEDRSPNHDGPNNVMILPNPEPDVVGGEVCFVPHEEAVVFVGMKTSPRRYGPVFCSNRKSALWKCNYATGDMVKLGQEDNDHVRSPRMGTDGSVYYLTNAAGGPHVTCSAVHRIDLNSLRRDVVVAQVNAPSLGEFPGIYAQSLSHCCETLAVTSQVRSSTRVLSFDVHNGASEVKPYDLVENDDSSQSWSMLGSGKSQAVLMLFDPTGNIELRHYNFKSKRSTTIMREAWASDLQARVTVIRYANRKSLESILYMPSSDSSTLFSKGTGSKPPVLICPHGGPHSAFSASFSRWRAAMLDLGIAVLEVNYTGSLGFGKDSVDALIGRVGELDVDDVQFARDELVQSGLVDAERIGLFGGSHGGFLTAWLVGLYPDSYKCAVLRNPVINLGQVMAQSDIPDWACAEGGIRYDLNSPPLITPTWYERMWNASPMSVAGKVKVPVLAAVGAKDRRVPHYEGLNWITYLRGQGHENARCYEFPEDGHSLDSDDAFWHGFTAVMAFFKEFL